MRFNGGSKMRVTVSVSEKVVKDLKMQASYERKSLSALVAESIEYYTREKKRKDGVQKLRGMAGKVKIDDKALEVLHAGRVDDDRS
jgi:hypothetical protein